MNMPSFRQPRMDRGSMTLDIAGALTVVTLLMLVVAAAISERGDHARQERRSAGLDTAQDLLAAARHGGALPPPPGWTVTRHQLAGGAVEVRVRSREVALSTLVPSATAPEGEAP